MMPKTHLPLKTWFITLLIPTLFLFQTLFNITAYAGFWADQGRDLIIIKNFINLHAIPLKGPIASTLTLHTPPGFYYLYALPFLFIKHFSPLNALIWWSFYHSLSFVFAFFLLKNLNFPTKTSLLTSLFLSLIPQWVILVKAGIWNPSALPPLTLLSYLLLAKHLQKPTPFLSILLGIILGLTSQFHLLAFFLIPTFTLFYLLSKTKHFHFFITFLLLTYLPYFYYQWQTNLKEIFLTLTFLSSFQSLLLFSLLLLLVIIFLFLSNLKPKLKPTPNLVYLLIGTNFILFTTLPYLFQSHYPHYFILAKLHALLIFSFILIHAIRFLPSPLPNLVLSLIFFNLLIYNHLTLSAFHQHPTYSLSKAKYLAYLINQNYPTAQFRVLLNTQNKLLLGKTISYFLTPPTTTRTCLVINCATSTCPFLPNFTTIYQDKIDTLITNCPHNPNHI